jgi:predicted nucleic acid-binding protein
MIVVCNTSPLTNLAAIGQFSLLQQLYTRLHIADGVWEELNAGGQHWPGRDQVAAAEWIEQHSVQNQDLVTALRRDLDKGEAETIALALELGADLVLLDEREGRHAAQRLDLRVSGVVGLLLEGKSRGAVTAVRPHLDALRHRAGFYLGEPVYRTALSLAGESDA